MSRKDPWRYRCPEGHASWYSQTKPKNGGQYYCECCDAKFDELVDMKRDSVAGAD